MHNPRQTVLVSCSGIADIGGKKSEKDNLIAVDWHTPLSHNPLMYAVAVGKTRFSLQLIQSSGVFCVNFIPFTLEKQVLFCGRNSGIDIDKFKETKLTKQSCEKIECCKVGEACAWFECEVVQQIETGDHILFIAKVLKAEQNNDVKRLFHVSGDKFTTTKD